MGVGVGILVRSAITVSLAIVALGTAIVGVGAVLVWDPDAAEPTLGFAALGLGIAVAGIGVWRIRLLRWRPCTGPGRG